MAQEMSHSKKARCSECAHLRPGRDIFRIDGAAVCRHCLFGDTPPFTIWPIGFVSNTQKRDDSDFGLQNHTGMSRIVLLASQKRFMHKLEEEEKLTVVYYLHKAHGA